jgi:hypothetical protein
MDTEYVEGQRYPNAEHFSHGEPVNTSKDISVSLFEIRGLFISAIPLQRSLRIRHGGPVRRPFSTPSSASARAQQTVEITFSLSVALKSTFPLALPFPITVLVTVRTPLRTPA